MLYGCAAWTLTKDLENKVRRTQRRMLRMILGSGRRANTTTPDGVDTWVEWVRRTTREAETCLQELQLDDWITTHRRQKLEWARRLAVEKNRTWASRVLDWDPDPFKYKRLHARPRRRWLDDIAECPERNGIISDFQTAMSDDALFSSLII